MNQDDNLIIQAYQKLRTAIYFEKGNLRLRDRFVEFAEHHNNVAEYMQEWFGSVNKQEDSYDKIGVYYLPKKFAEGDNRTNENGGTYITNNRKNKTNTVERVFIYADIPIELHIVAVMWTIKYGGVFEEKLMDCCKANRLIVDEETKKVREDGKQLYKPYFKQYQNWWSKAIDEANHIIENGNNVYILNLDIKNYYHNVDIDLDKIEYEHLDTYNLHNLLVKTHKKYNKKFNEVFNVREQTNRLPISMYSSSVLANWYLHKLDEQIENQLMPAYYGRYVDDILLVFRSVSECYETAEQFIDNKLNHILKSIKDNGIQEFIFADYPNLKIQSDKTTLYYFDKEFSTSLLSKFEAEQRKKSSEFRFMSDEEDNRFSDEELSCFDSCFDNSDESSAKFKPQIEDKYKLSCFLSKFITRKMLKGADYGKVDTDKIKKFFKGQTLIKYFQYWEKLFTLYAVSKDEESFKQLQKFILKEIENVCIGETKEKDELWLEKIDAKKIKESLQWHLKYSETTALSLFEDSDVKENISKEIIPKEKSPNYQNYINQYYIRHQYLKEKEYNNDLPYDLHFYEKAFKEFKDLTESIKAETKNDVSTQYIERLEQLSKDEKAPITIGKETGEQNDGGEKEYKTIKINTEKRKSKVNIALVNQFVGDKAITDSRRYSNRELKQQDIEHYLVILDNVAKLNGCDMFVMPELSLPFELLPVYLQWAARKQKAFVAGLEYINKNNVVLNFDVACIPFELNNRKDCVPIFRLKNHYSPKEKEIINKEGFTVPNQESPSYNLINWDDFYFSVYNCFELTSLKDRIRVYGEVDAIFAIAYNPDTNYYNSIVEATARDMHCYVVLCNTSQYGDSQIVAPKDTESKFILKVKGGTDDKNPINILVGHLDTKALREYQLYADEKHKFKPLPAGYPKNKERLINASSGLNKNGQKDNQ